MDDLSEKHSEDNLSDLSLMEGFKEKLGPLT
jgi:hypothetical protein